MHLDAAFGIDFAVILAYFAAVIYVGLRFGQREQTLESFALGGRSIPWWAVLASIIAAETSAATFLGTPGEGFKLVNYTFLQLVLGTILGRMIVAFLFIKPFFDLNVYSIYEYLQVRFGHRTRYAASGIFLVTRVLASGARLYVAAIVLAVAFQLLTGSRPDPAQALLIYCGSIFVITLITAAYTSIGGIKAVVWTDLIQSCVMIGGAFGAVCVLLASVLQQPGGQTELAQLFAHSGPSFITTGTTAGASLQQNLIQILTSDYTIWAALLGMTFTTLATHGTDQDMVQRMLTAKDYNQSRRSLVLSGLADLPIGFVFLTIGLLLHVYYQVHADPALPKQTNEVFAYFILKNMPVGLRGLLVAGIFATSMGSLSAALNALATSFTRDFYQPFVKDSQNENGDRSVAALRTFTCIFAFVTIVVACATAYFVIAHPESRIIPVVLGIFGYTYGSLLGVFLLGLLTRNRGSDVGNLIAMGCGFVTVALLCGLPNQCLELLGAAPNPALESIVKIAYPWRVMIGSLATFAVGWLFKGAGTGEPVPH